MIPVHTIVTSWLGTAFVMLLIGGLFHVFIPWMDPSIEAEYRDTGLFRPWDGWTRYYMVVHPFGVSLPFTFGYIMLDSRFFLVVSFEGSWAD